MGLKIGGEVKSLGKDLAEGELEKLLERGQGVQRHPGGKALVEPGDGKAQQIVQHSAAQNTPDDGAPEATGRHDRDGDHSQDGDQHRHNCGPAGGAVQNVEGGQGDAGGGAVHNQARILKAEECDKQTDAGRDGDPHSVGDGVEDLLPQAGDSQQNKDDAVDQDHDQRIGVGEAKAHTNRVDKECVEPHAGGLCKGKIGQQSDQNGADHGRDGGRDIDGVVSDAVKLRKHASVDH